MLLNNVSNICLGSMPVQKIYLSETVVWTRELEGDDNITINLNGWKESQISNPDETLYYGVYESASNYQINNTAALMYITINNSPDFRLYIRSCSEIPFDTVVVSQLDQTIDNNTDLNDTSLVAGYCDTSNCNTNLSDYQLIELPNDGLTHTVTVMYRKDGTTSSEDDKGYILIPKA